MKGDLILKNAKIVTADRTFCGEIRIHGEQISQVTENAPILPLPGDRVIDCTGRLLLPGGIDAHTHFDMPCAVGKTSDNFAQGSRAAVLGGTTTVLDFAEPDSGAPLQQGLDTWHGKADGTAYCDYGFHMTITGWDTTTAEQMADMVRQGVPSFKVYTAYPGMQISDDALYHILKEAKKLGALVMVHSENGALADCLTEEKRTASPGQIANHPLCRPELVEKEAVSRVIDIAQLADSPVYIVHLSARRALETALRERAEGAQVLLETCPHYLLLEDSKYNLPGFESAKYVMSPPLRKADSQEALWKALADDQIQTLSTDHCSFFYKGQKDRAIEPDGTVDFSKIPGGIPSVEHRMSLLYTYGVKTGRITLQQFVRLTATNPAKIFGLYPKKGEIAPGSDADLILIQDISETGGKNITAATQAQHVDYTPYEGFRVDNAIQDVFLRGTQIVADGVLQGEARGLFLPSHLYAKTMDDPKTTE